MAFRKRVLFVLLLLAFNQVIFPQTTDKTTDNPSQLKNELTTYEPGHIYSAFRFKDSTVKSDFDMTEMVNVIVEFKDAPLFIQMKENGIAKGNLSAYKARQVQLKSAVSNLFEAAQKVYKTGMIRPFVTREFYKLFNGCAMTVPRAILSDIAELDFVKKVHPARTYKVDLKESVKIIGADKVWAEYGNKGDSVVVGIIDTGIDYLHPALGGGFGKGFKVIGGYDYSNNDNDPMDDHSHGTHVAGIVAGNNSIIQGVAPNALLMAFKVLNSNGRGEDKEVIAGIEGAVDPNNDNNFDDKVDIANMSIGDEEGNGEDPVSIAVNNAVKLGVTICASAGNTGSYNKLGSPASAAEAITVAATNKSDAIADFSSKGPASGTFALKPEIAAPGVQIYSSIPGNAYGQFDGTSMSSPMISGVCALLKRAHKDWTPQMIKSALMTTAKDIGADALAQGAGRVQADKAIKMTSFSVPATLSFGLDDLEKDTWIKKDTITIINSSSLSQNYNISISGVVQGISINPDVSGFSLQPGQSKEVVFTLVVDNNVLRDLYQPHCTYIGKVKISGVKDTLNIPWGFSKFAILTLNFNKPVLDFFVVNSEENYFKSDTSATGSLTKAKLTIPPGNYRILVEFAKLTELNKGEGEIAFVIKNNLPIKGYEVLNISSDEAVNKINFDGVDENGRLLRDGENAVNNIILQLNAKKPYLGLFTSFVFGKLNTLPAKMSVRISDTEDSVEIVAGQYQSSLNKEKRIRVVQFPTVKGVHSDLNFFNKPSDLLKENLIINLPPTPKIKYICFRNVLGGIDYCGDFIMKNDVITERNWEGQLYMSKEADGYNISTTALYYNILIDSVGYLYFDNGVFRASGDSVGYTKRINLRGSYHKNEYNFYPTNSTFIFGNGVIYPDFSYVQLSERPFLYFNFKGMYDEVRGTDLINSNVSVYDKNGKFLYSKILSDQRFYNFSDDLYKYVVKNQGYYINGIPGLVTLSMDVRYAQPSFFTYCAAPSSLRLTDNKGNMVTKFSKGDEGYLSFMFSPNPNQVISSKVFVRRFNSKDWEEVKNVTTKPISTSKQFTVNLSEYTKVDSGKVDVKISFTDTGRLTTEYTLEPAFTIGNFVTSVEADTVKTAPLPKQFALHANYPNPFNPSTIIKYEIPRQSHVELKIYDVLGREIAKLINQVQNAGVYNAVFNASNYSSGIYFYSIKADGYSAVRKMLLIK